MRRSSTRKSITVADATGRASKCRPFHKAGAFALRVNACLLVGQRCSHDHVTYALTCSGTLTVRSAIYNFAWYSKPRTDDGADGTPSNSTLLEDFMSAAVNQALASCARGESAWPRKSTQSCTRCLATWVHQARCMHTLARRVRAVPVYACRSVGHCSHAHTRDLTLWHGAEAPASADDAERKVALVLEHGLRPNRRAAEAFVAVPRRQRFKLADYQQRIEALVSSEF